MKVSYNNMTILFMCGIASISLDLVSMICLCIVKGHMFLVILT